MSQVRTSIYAQMLRRKNRWRAAGVALVVTLLAAACVFSGVIEPLDRWFYDVALHSAAPMRATVPQPESKERPLLIEINEASLTELGRWPWPRSVHANLLNRLNQAPPKVVGFDIVFAQPETQSVNRATNDADTLFADAINRANFPVVLATIYERMDAKVGGRTKIIRPEAPLDQSSARLAHIHASIDPDGAVRRLYLQEGYAGFVPLPYLGYALHTPRAAPRSDAALSPLKALPELARADNATDVWQLHRPNYLYPLATSDFERISYADVVRGRTLPEQWRGRTVLVSTTAAGLGDQYVSPVYSASTIMPGGDIVLALLNTLRLQDQGLPELRWANEVWAFLAAMLLSIALVLSFRVSSLSRQTLVLMLAVATVTLTSLLLFARTGWFVSPMASVMAAILTFAFWLLLRLQTVLAFGLSSPATPKNNALGNLLAWLPSSEAGDHTPRSRDPVDAHLLRLASQSEAHAAARNTLSAVLQVLPDAAFVLAPQTDGHSGVWLANDAATRLMVQHLTAFDALNAAKMPSFAALMQPFQALLTSEQLNVLAGHPFHWQLLLRRNLPPEFASGVAARSADGARFLVKTQALQAPAAHTSAPAASTLLPSQGFVLSLLDLSVSQQLAAQRDASLQFLSHDLRSPPAAILAMLELESVQHTHAAPLLKRIGHEAQRTLDLAEGFVQLSRAEQSEVYNFAPYDLNDLAIEAADELWAPAKRRGIRIDTKLHDEVLLVHADRTMLWRAIVNLLSNAVRHSPENALITVTLHKTAGAAAMHIQDAGSGIAPAVLTRLFQRFAQGETSTQHHAQGAGLGLAFVKTVLEHHGGAVLAVSPCTNDPTPNGTRFELSLPLLTLQALNEK